MELDSSDAPVAELRLVLVGMTGSGRSSSGNTILGQKKFKAGCSSSSVTRCCQLESAELMLEGSSPKSRTVSVLDMPGFDDTSLTEEEVKTEVCKCVSLLAPGPHAFLLVVSVCYTNHQNQAISAMAKIFGEEAVSHHTVVLFTRGDDLEDTSIETFIKEGPDDLRDLVHRCGGRYHVFNNKESSSSEQVMKLLEKVDHIVEQRGFYTNSMFKEAEAIVREEEERLIKLLDEEERRGGGTRARQGAAVVKRQLTADERFQVRKEAALSAAKQKKIKTILFAAGAVTTGVGCLLGGLTVLFVGIGMKVAVGALSLAIAGAGAGLMNKGKDGIVKGVNDDDDDASPEKGDMKALK